MKCNKCGFSLEGYIHVDGVHVSCPISAWDGIVDKRILALESTVLELVSQVFALKSRVKEIENGYHNDGK